MESLLTTLNAWRPFRVLVVGDFMLDQMVYGDAERLAADSPVPVLLARRTEEKPGGAANVCLDLAAMRGTVRAFGVTGTDPEARLLREAMGAEHVDARGLIPDPGRCTTVKRSLIGLAQHRHPQKMFRVDFESRQPVPAAVTRELLSAFEGALADADAVCIEDYDKGVCTPETCAAIIALARSRALPVFVDPAHIKDYSKYRGCTAITPNRVEAEKATGMTTDGRASVEHNAAVAAALMDQLGCEAVVLTLDRHGALLLEQGQEPLGAPTVAREVYDVTGAGDMFLAGLTAGRCNGLSWADAVRLANAAAGLEVEVFGVVPIPLERIRHEMLRLSGRLNGKLRTLDEVVIEAQAVRQRGGKVVFTNGCFDILHAGHVDLLEKAAAFGNLLVVGLNDDASVRRLKGESRPVKDQDERAKLLGAIGCVGAVVLFGDDTPMRLIEAIAPDVLVKGADYTKDKVVGGAFVESHGGRVELIRLVEGKSTTGTIERMKR
jgi:D-beta-D-heptose 7-phosphate kinase/D-beta-D-heptose 1-phosphate adenosyltransferase